MTVATTEKAAVGFPLRLLLFYKGNVCHFFVIWSSFYEIWYGSNTKSSLKYK